MDDDFTATTQELAACAQINFRNMELLLPALRGNPIWELAKAQLVAVCKRLDVAEEVKP